MQAEGWEVRPLFLISFGHDCVMLKYNKMNKSLSLKFINFRCGGKECIKRVQIFPLLQI